MSILYMEGAEDIAGSPDLQARGVGFDNTNTYFFGSKPARYAGGKALVRGNAAAQNGNAAFRRRLPSTLADAIFYSYQFYKTSFNVANTLQFPGVGKDGLFISGFTVSNVYKTSTDGINWSQSTAVFTGGTPNGTAPNMCWDPTRNQYWAAYNPNTVSIGPFTSTNLPNWTLGTVFSNASIVQQTPRFYFDAVTNRMWLATLNDTWVLDSGATTWVSTRPADMATTDQNSLSIMAFDPATGRRWFAAGAKVWWGTSSDTTWTPSAALAGTPITKGIAFGNGRVVVATSNFIFYSTDDGLTFTSAGAIPGYVANASTFLTFFKGAFYLMSRGNVPQRIFRSVDGVTWEMQAANLFPLTGAISNLSATDTHLWAHFTGVICYTTDGMNWSVLENGGSSNMDSTIVNGLTPAIAPNSATGRNGIVVQSNDLIYANGVATTTTLTRDAWHMLEGSWAKVGPGQYQKDLVLDGTPLQSSTVNIPDWGSMGIGPGVTNMWPIVSNGSVTLFTNSAGSLIYRMVGFAPGGMVQVTATITGAHRGMYWTGKQFILVTDGPISGSYDGQTWRILTNTGTGMGPMGMSGNTLIACTSSAAQQTRYWRSEDGGDTWVERAMPSWGGAAYAGAVFKENGVWFVLPYAQDTVPWMYSTDDGLTWQLHPTQVGGTGYVVQDAMIAKCFGSTFLGLRDLSPGTPTNRLARITVTSATEIDVTFVNTANVGGVGARYVVFNGRNLFTHAGGTNPVWRSGDGVNWNSGTSVTGSQNTVGFIAIGSVLFFGSSSTAPTYFVVPEFFDNPFDFTFDSFSFSSYDDIIVNDSIAPFAGPLGEGRLLKVPLDTATQSQWAPTPSGLTNVQAATQQTVTQATAFVESNEAGQKDIYGTSAFTVPPGYRAAAVQVDGYYTRTLNTIPAARLGLESGAGSETTPSIPVTAAIGTKLMVSKIIQSDPATGGAWTGAAVANAKVTNERVE